MLFAGGYGAGKTRAGAEKALRLALANPGTRGQIVAPTWQMLTRLSLDAFLRACPKQLIAEHHRTERRIELVNGSTVLFGSADRPGALEGTNLAWAWVDEGRLVSSDAWRVIVGRLREARARQLQCVVTTTPAMGWLEEEFNRGKPNRRAIHASTAENAKNLAEGTVDELRRTYSPRLAKALIDGQFAVLAGAVYEDFDETRHVVDWEYDPRHPLWLSWDFGIRASSVLFAQVVGDFGAVDRKGRRIPPRSVVVFDEVQLEQKPTAHQVDPVKKRLAGRPVARIVCDPAVKQRSQDTGLQSTAILREKFGPIVRWEEEFVDRHIPNRIERVCGALNPVEGEPTLYVARSMLSPDDPVAARRGLVKSLRGSVYPEKDGRVTSDLPKVDEFEHARDTLEYLVVHAQNQTGRRPSHGATGIGYGARR